MPFGYQIYLCMFPPQFEEIFSYDSSTWLNLFFYSETVCYRRFRKSNITAGGRGYLFSHYPQHTN